MLFTFFVVSTEKLFTLLEMCLISEIELKYSKYIVAKPYGVYEFSYNLGGLQSKYITGPAASCSSCITWSYCSWCSFVRDTCIWRFVLVKGCYVNLQSLFFCSFYALTMKGNRHLAFAHVHFSVCDSCPFICPWFMSIYLSEIKGASLCFGHISSSVLFEVIFMGIVGTFSDAYLDLILTCWY